MLLNREDLKMKVRQALGLATARSGLGVGAWSVFVLAVASPLPAGAQQTTFLQGLTELTAAFEGTSGDEGARIGAALDRMSAALVAWDREIQAAESELRDTPANASPAIVVERHVSLGRI